MQGKVVKNAGWIIGCKLVKAVLTLVVTAITARYLGSGNYGLINYAASLVAFVVPIMQLGLNSTLVHEIVSRPEDEGKVVGTAMTLNFVSAFLCIIGVISFSSLVNAGETETIIVCGIYSILLLFQALEIIHYWFQAKLMAKFSAIAMLVAYVAVSSFQILLVVFGTSVYYFAFSYSIDFFIISIILIIIYYKKGGQKLKFSMMIAKQMLSVSKYYIISSLMTTLFAQTGNVMLKLMIDNSATGIYSAAVTCASMTSFVFVAIIDSFRPEIFAAKNQSEELFEKRLKELYSVIIYFSLLQCIAITLLAPLIIKIMYGDGFVDAVPVLRIAVWFTTFSYIGTVRDVWILSEGQQKYLLLINALGASVNIILNLLLIRCVGTAGAAISSVITQLFTNVIVGFIIKKIRRNNYIMIKSFNPKNIIALIKSFKGKTNNDGQKE